MLRGMPHGTHTDLCAEYSQYGPKDLSTVIPDGLTMGANSSGVSLREESCMQYAGNSSNLHSLFSIKTIFGALSLVFALAIAIQITSAQT